MATASKPAGRAGRRPVTSTDRISAVAIELFTEQGFEDTSVDQIAEAAHIGRRTFFRYFPSKNAVPWGDFDAHLSLMRAELAATPASAPLGEALRTALLNFNTYPPGEERVHRRRMALILGAPSLQAYSMLMYTGWRQVIADYVGDRAGIDPHGHAPQTIAWMLLGVALAAYEQWLADESADLLDLLDAGARTLAGGLDAFG